MLIKGHCSQKERTRCVSLFMWNSEQGKRSWVCPVTPSRATHGSRVMHTAFFDTQSETHWCGEGWVCIDKWCWGQRGCRGWKECLSPGNFGKLCARLHSPTKACGTAGKTERFQRPPRRKLRPRAGVGSRNGTHVESVTPAVTVALAGGFLPRQGGEVVVAGKENGDKSFLKP